MTGVDEPDRDRLSRRGLLTAAGVGSAALAAGPLLGAGAPAAALVAGEQGGPAGDPAATPRVAGLHLQFGADASREVVVSWHTLQQVSRPRVLFGRLGRDEDRSAAAATASYTDAKSGQVVFAHHARLTGLRPDTDYAYAAAHRGAEPELGSFAPPRAAGPASRSPASATRAPRRSASATPHRPG